jgi:hypothetical protein
MTTRLKTTLAVGIALLTMATAAPVLVAVNAEPRGQGPGFGGPPPGGPGGPGMRRPGGPTVRRRSTNEVDRIMTSSGRPAKGTRRARRMQALLEAGANDEAAPAPKLELQRRSRR